MVALVGEVTGELLADLGRTPNVAVTRPPASAASEQAADTARQPGWEAGAQAMREAARLRSMYVIVPADPLAGVAASWQQMWDPAAGSPGAAGFESSAADALAAWQQKRFELPDYYLVIAPAQGSAAGPDLYLGPLRAVRPRRVCGRWSRGQARHSQSVCWMRSGRWSTARGGRRSTNCSPRPAASTLAVSRRHSS